LNQAIKGFIMGFIRQLSIERLATVILFILLFVMAVSVPLDTDTWWHIRSGEYFLDEGKILREDIFSFSQRGEGWINHSWGGQVILALAYRLTGGEGSIDDNGTIGLALYTAILSTAGMAVIYQMCSGNAYSRVFVVVIGAATAAIFWSPRPQMFSFLLSTVVLYLLYLYKYKGRDWLWGLPVIMVLWVNLHGGFAIGFIYLFGFIAGEFLGNLLDPHAEYALGWRRLGKLGLITVIAVLALSLNPFGPRMMLYPFETAGLQTLNLFIAEWLSPNFKNPQTWAFMLMVFAILGLAGITQKRLAWSQLSLTVGTGTLALFAARNIAMFAVAATPLLSKLVDTFLTERGWQIHPVRRIKGLQLAVNWILLLVVLLGGIGKMAADLNKGNVRDLQGEYLPVDALAYLKANPPQGNLLNDYNWGGLLIFALPDIPVFVDGRTDLYGDDFLKAYFKAVLGASDWREIIDQYDIQTVLMPDESALSTLLREDENWEVVYEDEQAVILQRIESNE
jgi:hypothetical protein